MKRSRICQLAVAATCVLAAGVAATPAGASSSSNGDRSDVPTFRAFEASTYRDLDRQYIVNGDETIKNRRELEKYYDRMVGSEDKDTKSTHLVVNTVFGSDDVWGPSQALNLTYCVSAAFRSQQTNVINAMAQGAALWENASAGVDFTYVPSANSNCRTSNNAVLFSVEPTRTTQYIARAFFPSSSDAQRNVLVNASSLMNSGSWTPGNILGHELGHFPRVPPRAHPARGGHLLRGQQLAAVDAVRLGLDHALPPVQRDLRRPQLHQLRRRRRALGVRRLTEV